MVTEILDLRSNRISSVETLLAALEWQKAAQYDEHILLRDYDVTQAADLVLLNVAAHALEMQIEPPVRGTRRALLPFRRKPRRSDPGQLHQRRSFA